MKKIVFLSFMFLFFVILPAYAVHSYYVTRSGDILQVGTDFPIFKNTKINLICNVVYVKNGMDRYVMVKDDGSPYTRRSLVGCQDYSSSNVFDPIVVLNSDKITEKVTSEELKKANIRFVNYKGASGTLDLKHPENDLDLDKIAFIDLTNMRFYADSHGELYMYLKPKNEDRFSNNLRYMKQLLIEIRQIPLQYGDRMIKGRF